MAFTGERFTPETLGEIWHEHWHRYCAILDLAKHKVVVDVACGEGYGSALLAQTARQVIGLDRSEDVIRHAHARYGERPELAFACASVTDMPLADASVDLIVTFETIEHIKEQEGAIRECRRVLRPDGVLVVSSPNRPVYSEARNYRNEFHVRELNREELASILTPLFPQQHWYAQRLLFSSLIWSEVQTDSGFSAYTVGGERAIKLSAPADPMYFIVVCGGEAASLPRLDEISVFTDREQSIYREFERATQAERRIYTMYLEQERQISELQARLANLGETP